MVGHVCPPVLLSNAPHQYDNRSKSNFHRVIYCLRWLWSCSALTAVTLRVLWCNILDYNCGVGGRKIQSCYFWLSSQFFLSSKLATFQHSADQFFCKVKPEITPPTHTHSFRKAEHLFKHTRVLLFCSLFGFEPSYLPSCTLAAYLHILWLLIPNWPEESLLE